jgi:hypothetical protein
MFFIRCNTAGAYCTLRGLLVVSRRVAQNFGAWDGKEDDRVDYMSGRIQPIELLMNFPRMAWQIVRQLVCTSR